MAIHMTKKMTTYPKEIVNSLLVKIGKFVFPIDFVVIEMEEDYDISIILGWPFVSNVHADFS